MMLYILIFGILLSDTIGINLIKEYRTTGHLRFFFLGYGFYVCLCLLLVQTFRYETMGIVNVLWSAFSVMLVVTTGHLFFHERVSRQEILGIAMALAGVAIITL